MITIPGYEIDAELYQSAGSLIYRARHNHRNLVIKLPRNEYPTPGEIARYQHEYELVRKLNKQNMSGVVQMIALERQERRPVLIEAYVPGEPLRELLLRETPKLFSVLDMAASFLRCLINLHDNGILHLDIQPSNLIWDREQKEITLIDFGSATFLAHQNPEVIGVDQADLVRLAHISPEQSGRMNRPVDYRSDFYSFGILLFELLTGRVPFESADPLELVHSHLARTAPRANKFNSHVPEQLAEITARLLAKNPEDRYQSAEGILHDLETCRRHLLANGQIPAFTPGEKDVSDRFRLSHKLYGRRTEFEEIDRILNELKNGTAALLLLQGEAGIGKTALASAMQRRLPVIQGRMISGQYDEIKNNQPYSALITALQDLTRQLLTESEERLQAWRALINDALGDRISELLDVLPGLEAVLGARSLPDNGSPAQEPGSRFQSLLVQFVKLFAREESPLVLLLDDIQWIDRSSVDFLHGLYTDPELRFILIVCAYRPQEVPSNHPFQQLLDRIRRNGYEWFSIQPRALDIGDIVRLLADSLGNAREDCRYLAEVVYQKTGGNPFFIREFLTHLSESRLIYYEDHWRWDLNRIQSTGITENIVELMGERIRALPEATQRVVRLSACLGSRFYIDTLAGVYGSDEESTIHDLIPAINEGMILFGDESASFVHDRIRQAAYHQLSADERKQAHYRAGQILLNNSPDDLLKKRIFVITDHLNEAIDLITESKDRLQLARFNLLAGKRSRQAAAHDAARTYFERGMSLLPEDHWSSHPELSRDLFFSRAESEFINNNLEQADNFFQILLKHVENLKDRLRIYESLVALHTSQNRPETALRIGREALRHAGIELPHEHETGRLRFWRQYIRLRWMLSRRTDSELINAPQVRDSVQQVAMRILVNCATPAAQINRHYYYGLVVRMMLFILECGNVECSPCVFAMYASLNISRFNNFETGFRFARLTRAFLSGNQPVIQQGKQARSRVLFIRSAYVDGWFESYDTLIKGYEQSARSGVEAGGFQYTANAIAMLRVLEMFRGITPQERERLNRRYDPIVQATRIQNAVRLYNHRDYCERRLTQEETPPGNPASETDAEYDSRSTINGGIIPGEVPRGNHGHKFMILLCSMMCEFMLGNLDAAARLARSARRHNRLTIRTTHAVDFDFYDALILMQLYRSAPNAKRMRQIKATVSRMHRLSRRFPDHFQHRAALLRAEYLSLENGPATATRSEEIMQLYDRAVDGAARGRIPLEEALANECAARFHYRHQRHKFARLLLAEAIYLYDSLGMDAVIARLRREFHSIAVADSAFMPLHARRMPDSHLSQLDMMTVLRSSRALSSEIVLGKLLARLMQILIENAGASRGCFLMERDGRLYIEAEGTVDQQDVQVLQYVPAEESERVPMTILHYVARTRKNIVLSDATRSDMFQNDPFIKANQTRSLLCTPVIHQGKLIGIVYLENNLNSGAFTPERLEVIETLSSQAAISVENARLYLDLEEKVTERTHDLNNALTEVRALKEQQDGDYFLTSLLVQPLTTGRIASETVQIDFFLRQKKQFHFKKWDAEIGGDINVAHTIEIGGETYTAFMNADAMGKSIQGAAGTLVIGAVFESFVERQIGSTGTDPAGWLTNAFTELHRVFDTFSGYMMITLVLGLVHDRTGLMHYVRAEHPPIVLYRDDHASFLKEQHNHIKLGMPGGRDRPVVVDSFALQSGDVIIVGTDGRDDLCIGTDERGFQIVNENEELFLEVVQESAGNLERIHEGLLQRGDLMDDLALIRIQYDR